MGDECWPSVNVAIREQNPKWCRKDWMWIFERVDRNLGNIMDVAVDDKVQWSSIFLRHGYGNGKKEKDIFFLLCFCLRIVIALCALFGIGFGYLYCC